VYLRVNLTGVYLRVVLLPGVYLRVGLLPGVYLRVCYSREVYTQRCVIPVRFMLFLGLFPRVVGTLPLGLLFPFHCWWTVPASAHGAHTARCCSRPTSWPPDPHKVVKAENWRRTKACRINKSGIRETTVIAPLGTHPE